MTSILGSAAFMVSVEQFRGEGAGGSTLGLKTSGSVKTSPCIKLACEQEGEQDLVLLGGKEEELVGDVLGTDVEIDPMGRVYLQSPFLVLISIIKTRLSI